MDEIIQKLTDYTLSLKDALENTNVANERPLLAGHLVAAAKMYALLYTHKDVQAIETIIKSEIRAHGWSYISGDAGYKVAESWVAFTNFAGFKR